MSHPSRLGYNWQHTPPPPPPRPPRAAGRIPAAYPPHGPTEAEGAGERFLNRYFCKATLPIAIILAIIMLLVFYFTGGFKLPPKSGTRAGLQTVNNVTTSV
ncbi:hypothetical protein BDN72DRAFT_845384, partial [Pluteus cervinus]